MAVKIHFFLWLHRVQFCCQTHQVRSDSSYEHLNYWSNILMLHYTDLLNLKNEKACVQIQSFQTNLHKEIQIKLCSYRNTLINFMLCIQCGCSSYICIIFGLHIYGRLHFCSVLFVVTLSSFGMYCCFIFLYLFLCTVPFMLHSLLSSDYYTVYFVMFLLCICTVLAAPASLQVSVVIDCCCLVSSCLCVNCLYT